MATGNKKPGADLGDLKARLGLNKALEKKPEPVAPPPEEPAPAPQAFGAAPPSGYAPQPGYPGAQPGQAPFPQGHPAGPPPAAFNPPPRPPRPKPRPAPAQPDWQPPPSDPSAAADVPIQDHSSRSKLLILIGGIALAAVVFGAAGYVFGSGGQTRALYDAQTTDAKNTLDKVKPKVDKVSNLYGVLSKHDGAKPDPEVLAAMEDLDFAVDPGEIASGRILLGPELTGQLIQFTADSQLLKSLIAEHVRYSTKVDKKELEEILQDQKAQEANFAVLFDADTYVQDLQSKKGDQFRPPQGQVVVYDNQDPTVKKDELYAKVRYPKSGKEIEVPMKSLVLLQASDMLRAGGQNALTRYTNRHRVIVAKLQEMSQYSEVMVKGLTELSGRGPAPLLSISE